MNTNLQRTQELIESLQVAHRDGDSDLTSAEIDNLMERARHLEEIFSDTVSEF
jgi:hypothetical protein